MATIPQSLQEQYEKALTRAHAEQLTVRSKGVANGERIFWVENPANEPGSWYVVRFPKGAHRMTCNCQAGMRSVYCKHVALVRETLLAEVAAKAAQAAKPAAPVAPTAPRAYTQAELFAREAALANVHSMADIPALIAPTPAPAPVAPVAPAKPAPELSDGYYTVVFSDGDRRTFRLTTQPQDASFAPGERIVGYLAGPDNGHDYRSFAFLSNGHVHIWKRFAQDSTLAQAARVLENPEDAANAGLAYALASGHCYRCNRLLTVPASINRGLGPECAKRVG